MTDRIDQIIEKLQQLKEIRQHLVNEPMSESGVWIHQYLTFHGMWKGEIGSRMIFANHCDFLYLEASSTKSFKP
ncbi:hypothetical protein [Nostoc foliaceum]|uniref:hypothetical protein n=1 Tax=Nostoc foliaceum TaxID=2692914 RepID=UPI0016880F04|nr:hypothetical protein [Nostoc foliaceum]